MGGVSGTEKREATCGKLEVFGVTGRLIVRRTSVGQDGGGDVFSVFHCADVKAGGSRIFPREAL